MRWAVSAGVDRVLRGVVERENGVPGVVAMATDRKGNTYEGAAGVRALGKPQPMTLDSVFALFSATKAITGVAVMQLVEEGVLGLDDPAGGFVPEIDEIRVLDGFDASGTPRLRAPRSAITVRQLLLHTAGFGYVFFNQDLLTYCQVMDVPSTAANSMAVLLHDPGECWEYGTNIDWAGRVVEAARGKRLGEVCAERIFGPLGMTDTAFAPTPSMWERHATLHQRGKDGALTPLPSGARPPEPELHMGGHGLYATVGDYMRFIRMLLNDGAGAHGRVLTEATAARMSENGLGALKIRMLPGAMPSLSNDMEFFPGMPKSWGYTFMINDEDAPTGRPAGALGWAGMANLYYWIDNKNGIGGFWATQLFPFADPISFGGSMDFETAIYEQRL